MINIMKMTTIVMMMMILMMMMMMMMMQSAIRILYSNDTITLVPFYPSTFYHLPFTFYPFTLLPFYQTLSVVSFLSSFVCPGRSITRPQGD
jgi:hypothetical protein